MSTESKPEMVSVELRKYEAMRQLICSVAISAPITNEGLHLRKRANAIIAAAPAPAAPHTDSDLLKWAVDKWHLECANRPLVNVHRAGIDGTWRQVIRKLGGDPESLIGPDHYALVKQAQERGEWRND